MMYSSTVEDTMIDTCRLHDDLEDFASYLGVDYDDYYQLIYNLPDVDDENTDVESTQEIEF